MLIRAAGLDPAAHSSLYELLELGMVQLHPCEDGFIRITATADGRRWYHSPVSRP